MPNYSALLDRYGSPLYLYREQVLAEQLSLLRKTFPDFSLLYSLKANPHPAISRFMAGCGIGIDAASSYEVKKALEAGVPPERIYYSAPGKTDRQLSDSLGTCRIIADSLSELVRLDALADRTDSGNKGERTPAGLRINPQIAFGPGESPAIIGGVSAKFGVDEESLLAHKPLLDSLKHVRVTGIHVFLRSQVLSHAALAALFDAVFALAVRCREILGRNPEFVNFGAGLGIPSSGDSAALDLDSLRHKVRGLVKNYAPSLPGCALLLESGRFLAAKAGIFLCRIEDIKESRGTRYVIAPGGLNGFLRPPVMNLLHAMPSPLPGPYEPLFSSSEAHRVSLPEKNAGKPQRVTVCGNLCTSLDVLAKDILLPDPQVGDILAISNAGAYAATLSPFAFASFPRPAEIYMDSEGSEVTQ